MSESKELTVRLSGIPAGILFEADDGRICFQYRPDYLVRSDAYPLSISMPLSDFIYQNIPAIFFANLLPDDPQAVDTIGRMRGVSPTNIMSMMNEVGHELPGAVTVTENNSADWSTELGDEGLGLKELSDGDIKKIYENTIEHPLLLDAEGEIRLSLPGFQPKIGIRIVEDKYYLPIDRSASSHILKPEPPHWRGLALNEYFCMKVAKRCGMDVAEVALLQEIPALLIQRFDRVRSENSNLSLRRIHQEDFCQALGVLPQNKYQSEGGPRVSDFSRIAEMTVSPSATLLKLFDQLVFHYLVGNTDAHGKNYSLLYSNGALPELAPMYDVVSVEMYGAFQGRRVSKKIAMKIAGKTQFNLVYPRHWQRVANELGLSPTAALRRARILAERVLNEAQAELQHLTTAGIINLVVPQRIQRLIQQRTEQLLGPDPIAPDTDDDGE